MFFTLRTWELVCKLKFPFEVSKKMVKSYSAILYITAGILVNFILKNNVIRVLIPLL